MHICITKILHTKLFIWDFRSMLAFLVIFQGWLSEVQKHACISCHDSGMTYIKLSSFVKINNFYFTNISTAMMCDRYIMWLTWIWTLCSNLLLGKGRPKFVNDRRDIKCHQCITIRKLQGQVWTRSHKSDAEIFLRPKRSCHMSSALTSSDRQQTI